MSKSKMSKGKGYASLALLLLGVLFLWLSIANMVLFVMSVLCFALVIWIYYNHVKKGGITLQEAWNR